MIHVIPMGDTCPHEEDTTCPCQPTVDASGAEILVIHNAFDGREAVEWANKLLSIPEIPDNSNQKPC
jgi:hypothetical protein